MRIVFAGTPQFAVSALEALAGTAHHVVAAYTQPDRPAGRGRELTASPVKQLASRLGIPVEQPLTLRDDAARAQLVQYAPDLMVVVAYGLLLPQAVLDVPRLGCVNIHASLLPRWRGAAPIHRAVLAGDARTGVAIMRMEAGLDTGPVYLSRETAIEAGESTGQLHDRLAVLGAEALLAALPGIADGTLQPRPQAAEGVSYAHKLEKREAAIDWRQPAIEIERRVRAFNPWPVAETRWQERQLRIWQARAVDMDARGADPGRVIGASAEGVFVACGAQVLALEVLQLPGRKPVSAAEFMKSQDVTGAQFLSAGI